MSSGFVSAGTISADKDSTGNTQSEVKSGDSWAAAESAIKLARWQQDNSDGGANDGKSLYEILQENKARKQEEFEEKLKFKHQFKPLDEDDVEFLDSILTAQARNEQLHKEELQAQLDEFRKAQYETELQMSSGGTGNLESLPKVEDIVVGGWKTSGRKRKKASISKKGGDSAPSTNPKKSRTTNTLEDRVENNGENENFTSSEKGPKTSESRTTTPLSPLSPASAKVAVPADSSKSSSPKSNALVGLVSYSSDDDD